MAAGVGVVVSSDGIDGEILTGYFVPIESQDENPDAQRRICSWMRVARKSGNMLGMKMYSLTGSGRRIRHYFGISLTRLCKPIREMA
jgi:hypothetical protein